MNKTYVLEVWHVMALLGLLLYLHKLSSFSVWQSEGLGPFPRKLQH